MIHIPQFFDELEALEAQGDYAFKLSSLLVPLMKKREPEILIENNHVLSNDCKQVSEIYYTFQLNKYHIVCHKE